MKLHRFIFALLISLFAFTGFVLAQGVQDIVESIEPATVEAGQSNLTVTITLLNLGTPPVPPSQVTPTSVKIGSIEGGNISRNELIITAVFDIPDNETNGLKSLTMTFPAPNNGTVTFSKSSAIEVTGGQDGGAPEDPVIVTPKAGDYVVVDTAQEICYDNTSVISAPQSGQAFYGQDAQFQSVQTAYQDNGDGTVTDLNTGLMWQQGLPEGKYPHSECVAYAESSTLAGYTDWRLPTIKELYSLILFSGVTAMDEESCIPYLDDDVFDFRFGGAVDPSERVIDAQYATSTIYKGTTMGGNETMFGVNFVDGRIKGYPTHKNFEIKMVRGKSTYGLNDYVDNEDGTITDKATGLMWDQSGSSSGMNWEEALAWVQQKNTDNYLGYDDWRLPDAKELQSIVDYDRSLSSTNSAAISPLFNVPTITDEKGDTNYPFYWASTTHYDGPAPNKAVYVCFGQALGYMNGQWLDVHGAGAQRSDPKNGDPNDYPTGHGPQGDAIRINNYVRLVRTVENTTGVNSDRAESSSLPNEFKLQHNYPNPFNPGTTITFTLPASIRVSLKIYNTTGQLISTLVDQKLSHGSHQYVWQANNLPSGFYYYRLESPTFSQTKRMVLLK